MLTRLQLENFKSWRNLDIELAPLTLLFGTNSSGKTAILQSLLLLKQTANSLDRKQHINFGGNERDYVDFGSWRDLVYEHNENNETHIGIDYDLNLRPDRSATKTVDYQGSYYISWKRIDDEVVIQHLYHDIKGEKSEEPSIYINVVCTEDGGYKYELPDNWTFQPISVDEEVGKQPSNNVYDAPSSCYGVPELQVIREIDGEEVGLNLGIFNSTFRVLMYTIEYLAPLRENPKRAYLWTGSSTRSIVPTGENTIAALLASERQDERLILKVSDWLKRLGLVDEFSIEPIDRDKRFYETRVKIGTTISSLLDVGFGVSQVLPVITLLYFAPEGSIILLEQPELHLHPSAQAVLTDLLLEVAETRKLQLIVESHSEHLLTRLQRRIAEVEHEFASPDNIKLYSCQIKNGESVAEPVVVDQYGQIKNWPENFFGDRGGDLDAMTDAALARRRQELEHSG